MRVSTKPLAVGVRITIGTHVISRTSEHGVTFDFNGALTPHDVANINAAIKPTGVRVEKYWRTGQVTVNANGTRTPAVGHVIVGSGTTTPATVYAGPTIQAAVPSAQPLTPAAPVQATLPPTPQPAPVLSLPVEDEGEAPDILVEADEFVTEEDAQQGHQYIPAAKLTKLWATLVRGVKAGRRPRALLFLGPSGSGKTDGAMYLANLAGLPFTKVDAASMNAPEDWFGTREVTAVDGTSVTTYIPSSFVLAIQKPGVTLIDEANRVRDEHRNVLYPLLDGTHRVMNPLTGQVIQMHPEHYIILSGNRGLAFTGTYAMDPALLTRTLVLHFDYLSAEDEVKVAVEASGCTERAAALFVRFANDVRTQVNAQMSMGGTDLSPVSTRQVIAACELVADGLDVDDAVDVTVINLASDDGGAQSTVQTLRTIWTGIRPTYDE